MHVLTRLYHKSSTECSTVVTVCVLSNWDDNTKEHNKQVLIDFVYWGYCYLGNSKDLTLIAKYYDVFSPEICMKKQRRIAKAIKRSRTMGEFITVLLASSCVGQFGYVGNL